MITNSKIKRQTKQPLESCNWGNFDKQNSQHNKLLSLLRQAQWVVPSSVHGEVADIKRLSDFLKSDKSPVNKPLLEMKKKEVSKIITAFEGIIKHKYK